MIHSARHLSVSIQKPFAEVYQFAVNPENLPKWAQGLSRSQVSKVDGEWIADSPMGKVKVRFTDENRFGILDHDVVLPTGQVVHNPLRVMRNGTGTEVVFTLYRLKDVSPHDFERDVQMVTMDLQKLKLVLER